MNTPSSTILIEGRQWKLVPVEPTEEMCRAGAKANDDADQEDRIWADMLAASPTPPQAVTDVGGGAFQSRVQPWMLACFGPEIAADRLERNDRFIEEALELVQASSYPKERAIALVDYVYGRDQGDINQEVGGVMVTLAAHCLAHGVDMHAAAETELARIWTKVEQIRAKQAAKPTGSALPIAVPELTRSPQPVGGGNCALEPTGAGASLSDGGE